MPDYTTPERARTALVTINLQRDFVKNGSPLRSRGVGAAMPGIQRLVEGFRAAGLPIVHAVRLYRPDGSNVDSFRRKAVEDGLRILMPGTMGAELLDEVKPSSEVRLDPVSLLEGSPQQVGRQEWLIYKPRWGAFHGTALEDKLRALGVSTVVLCGCNFSTSIRSTVYEAGSRDLRVILAPDAVTGASEEAITELGRIGVYLMNSNACLSWVAANPPSDEAA